MKFILLSAVTALLALPLSSHAHGPALSPAQLQRRTAAHHNARRAFSSCESVLSKRALSGAHERREEMIRRHQGMSKVRVKEKRQNATPTTTQRDIATGTNTASPFTGIATCVLAPDSVLGPYYLSDELIRPDIRESQPGVPLLLDLQIFDVKSCAVLPEVMVDFWHANATGVYSGYSAEGTVGDTWLRGLAESDKEGVAQITTIFPGHYNGRTIHIHIMAHINGSVEQDGDKRTYVGGNRPFVGQLFFNMPLITEVEAVAPYSSNKNPLTPNSEDWIFRDTTVAVKGYDGLMDVRKLGESVDDGIIAWISIGIDSSLDINGNGTSSSGGGGGDGGGGTSAAGTVGTPTTATTSTSASTSASTRASTGSSTTSGADGSPKQATGGIAAAKIAVVGMCAVIAAMALLG